MIGLADRRRAIELIDENVRPYRVTVATGRWLSTRDFSRRSHYRHQSQANKYHQYHPDPFAGIDGRAPIRPHRNPT